MNPYDFVPLPDRVLREAPLTHHKLHQHNGTVRCRLTAITPIFISATQSAGNTQRFITSRYHGAALPVIPGSSLKGAIRSVAEAVTRSCIGLSGTLFSSRGQLEGLYRAKVNKDFETCKLVGKLCPACRLFGMVSNQSHFLGKVSVGEGHTSAGAFKVAPPMILKPLMNPRPEHRAFYLSDDQIAGRKFYFHHSALQTATQAGEYTKTVYALEGVDSEGKAQTIFEFDVSFSNLTEYEYSVLLFALFLTNEMRHKIGGGKPLGLGTVKIEPLELRSVDGRQRYNGLAGRHPRSEQNDFLIGIHLADHIQQWTSRILQKQSASLEALRRILQYPPASDKNGHPIDYRYPERTWFDLNSDKCLAETP